jgi:hypothetical protein
MNPLHFALIDAWFEDHALACRITFNVAMVQPCSTKLRTELRQARDVADGRLGFWRSVWVTG